MVRSSPQTTPGCNGHTDSATEAVRLALDAIETRHREGIALPVSVLRDQSDA
ncbi:MAG: hypothetical protein ACRDSP_23750 [Pseudonocardiaceae bacterium]